MSRDAQASGSSAGERNATSAERGKLTILEFGDLQCPDSAAFAAQGRQQLIREFVSSGQATYRFHDFPLDSHPLAARAAEVARCAGANADQFRNQLYQQQMSWRSEQDLLGLAQAAGVDAQCLSSGMQRAAVQKDKALGQQYGVRATPTLVLGYTDASGNFSPVRNVRGDQPYQVVQSAIREVAGGGPAAPSNQPPVQ